MSEIELIIKGQQGSGKSVLLSLVSAMLQKNKIPFTLLEDEHKMKVSMANFIKNKDNA